MQTAGLVKKSRKRGVHRRRRPRRPRPGMLLHLDGSSHAWFQDHRRYDLLVILDDATNEIYYAQLVEEESTATVMTALREVIERKGAFCALYSDRASHFFYTRKAGQPVDRQRPTQVGRALSTTGTRLSPRAWKESRSDLCSAARVHPESRQHRAPRPLYSADREDSLARYAGRLSRHHLRTSG